jgi:hypothetical protein
MLETCISSGLRQEGAMEPVEYVSIEEDARESAAARLAHGKGTLPTEHRNEQAERTLAEEMIGRAKAGEHFASSLPRNGTAGPGRE